MYSTSDITGAIILNQIGRDSIGKWNEKNINLDKSTNSNLSVIGLAVAYYTEIASLAGVDLGALNAENTTLINASLIWYISGEYKRRDIEDMPKEQCGEEDFRLRANMYNRACAFLQKVSPSMASIADFCKYEESLAIDPSIFSTEGFTVDCGDIVDLGS